MFEAMFIHYGDEWMREKFLIAFDEYVKLEYGQEKF